VRRLTLSEFQYVEQQERTHADSHTHFPPSSAGISTADLFLSEVCVKWLLFHLDSISRCCGCLSLCVCVCVSELRSVNAIS